MISTPTRGLCAVQPVMTASREEVVCTWPVGASRRGDQFFFFFCNLAFFFGFFGFCLQICLFKFYFKNWTLHRRQYY